MATPTSIVDGLVDDPASLVDVALELLTVDTSNPPGDTREIVALLESYLADSDIKTQQFAVDESKPNLLATRPGKRETTLLFTGHLDTIPYDEEAWTHDPLGERAGDRIYGRGATDMKGAVAAMLMVARAFAEEDERPPVTLQFAFVSDEEVAGDAGLPALLDVGHLDADACVIGEPTCERGRHSVTVADRGSIWLTLEATGEAAHGSRPMLGRNAIDRLWAAVEAVRTQLRERDLSLPSAVEQIVDESVEYYAPSMGADTARRLFTHPTVNLGIIEGGESVNTVPQTARAQLDVRLTAGVDTEAVLADVRDCIVNHEGVTVADVSWSVGTYENLASPLVESVAATAEDVTGDRIYRRSATGGGDAKTLRNAGVPTVEFALGTDTVHAPDEYITIDALLDNTRVYAGLPSAFATAVDESSDNSVQRG
ncbi:M20/M25/M40 family metallo-hydrolase (plasmid) [Halorussus limi]|uniref:M20/M25/M40 family metallo-hydrolase n=1 Tax=Halorussus limi TaxID=2938695 RepID=A0A8U0I164_9EURY|nr:M20/M25/M40 family metallo-hydrolase [Halorussus limi]UPV76928.1 M20/M25/M40 family metallo-hydrolase [Halorussus limi]